MPADEAKGDKAGRSLTAGARKSVLKDLRDYWPCDEATGARLHNALNADSEAMVLGSTGWTESFAGSAVRLSAADPELAVPNGALAFPLPAAQPTGRRTWPASRTLSRPPSTSMSGRCCWTILPLALLTPGRWSRATRSSRSATSPLRLGPRCRWSTGHPRRRRSGGRIRRIEQSTGTASAGSRPCPAGRCGCRPSRRSC